jgi:hypothetical protein
MVKRYWVWLLVIWTVLIVSVFAMSYFYPNGRTSSDSYHYLGLARNILDGDGMYVKDAYEVDKVSYFAQWPPGYPLVIALVSSVTGIGVFWSAKIVNVIMLALIMSFLGLVYKEEAPTMGLIFLLASPLNVMSMTWSEPVMMLGLLIFSYFLYKLYVTSRWRWTAGLVVVYGWIFFTRYVGAFALLVVAVIFVLAYKQKKYQLMWQSLVVGTVSFLISVVYLGNNIARTGYVLGRASASNDLGISGILKLVDRTLLTEMNLLFDLKLGFWGTLISIFFLLLLAVFINRRNKQRPMFGSAPVFKEAGLDKKRAAIVAGVGASQVLSATYLLIFPGVIDNRYLMPVLVLGLVGLTEYLKGKPRQLRAWQQFLLVVVVLSWTVNVPGKIFYISVIEKNSSYPETVREVVARYEHVPSGSLVAFGDKRLEYLRNDLYTGYLAPEVLKMTDQKFNAISDKMTFFLTRSCETKIRPFYVDVNARDRSLSYWGERDVSVQGFLTEQEKGDLVHVDDCESSFGGAGDTGT